MGQAERVGWDPDAVAILAPAIVPLWHHIVFMIPFSHLGWDFKKKKKKKKKIAPVGTYCDVDSSLGPKFWLWDKKNILANFALLDTRSDPISNLVRA